MKFISAEKKVTKIVLEIDSDDLAALTYMLGKSSRATFTDIGVPVAVAERVYKLFAGFDEICSKSDVNWRPRAEA